MVIGHVDRLTGRYVVGWAAEGAEDCLISIRRPGGQQIASGTAGLERSDLAALGLGRATFAFRLKLPKLTRPTPLHVFANDVELPGSPIQIGAGLFDGDLAVAGARAEGWVSERLTSFTAPLVQIVDQDGRVVGETQSAFRDDADDPYYNPAYFSAELELRCFGAGELRLRAVAGGQWFAEGGCDLRLLGHMEHVEPALCSGWLFSPDAPHRVFHIEIRRDDEMVAVAACNRPRIDVAAEYAAVHTPGFRVQLPPRVERALDVTRLSLRLPGSDIELFEGPYMVSGMPAMVQAARRIAQLGHGLGSVERTVLQAALTDLLAKERAGQQIMCRRLEAPAPAGEAPILWIIVPIYRGEEATRICIQSLLDTRDPEHHRILLIDDCSPEPGLAAFVASCSRMPNVFVLVNKTNLGFVRTVNRGLSFCQSGAVLLLNADTQVFPGGLAEMLAVASADPAIGTVTALSNNATIFSYPDGRTGTAMLDDIGWDGVAELALEHNRGIAFDVPTGHGFCMLVTRALLRRIGRLDESFGRGYGEENDLCARGADLGFRNVAAAGAFVEHTESISFGSEKTTLLAHNLPLLARRYPEYDPVIGEVMRRDDLRAARWKLDAARLARAIDAGQSFAVVIQHALGGGTNKAIADIEAQVGYGGAIRLSLRCRTDGMVELSAAQPLITAVFAPDDVDALFDLLTQAQPRLVLIHQVLGYTAAFVEGLARWAGAYHTIFYAHDFYAFCQRVTMLNALGQFCGAQPAEVCLRCVRLGGTHESSNFGDLRPDAHRALFGRLFAACRHVVTPSENAASYLRAIFPAAAILAIPHPEILVRQPVAREADSREIVLLGAMGPHKGSAELFAIARQALLTHPDLRFRLIGFTDIDDQLLALGNVAITGPYLPEDLPLLRAGTQGRLALFLSIWPETYSYTLSEAVAMGLLPIVPDLGGMAERVRAVGFGMVIPYPMSVSATLQVIEQLLAAPSIDASDGVLADFGRGTESIFMTRAAFGLT